MGYAVIIMIRTQVSLDARMYEEAKSKRSGAASRSPNSAGALRPRREDKPWMRFAGALQSGDPEASRTVDEVVYVRERP